MPRRCTICTHPKREDIDKALVAGDASLRSLASLYGVSESALRRHKENHLPAHLAQAQEAQEVAQADDLLGQVESLRRQAQTIKDKAERSGDLRTALAGIRELVRIVELLAKLRGELDERPVVNLLLSPQWIQTRSVLLDALGPWPEARAAVARALMEVGSGAGG